MLLNIGNAASSKGPTNWVLYLRRLYTHKRTLQELNDGNVFDEKILMKDLRYILWVVNPSFNIYAQRKNVATAIKNLQRRVSSNVMFPGLSSVEIATGVSNKINAASTFTPEQHRAIIRTLSGIAPLALYSLIGLTLLQTEYNTPTGGIPMSVSPSTMMIHRPGGQAYCQGYQHACSKVADFFKRFIHVSVPYAPKAPHDTSFDITPVFRKIMSYGIPPVSTKVIDEPISFRKLRKLAMVIYSQAMRL